MRPIVLLLTLCLLGAHPIAAQSNQPGCPSPSDLTPRLTAGGWGRVGVETPNNLRADATIKAARIGRIPPGDIFRVIGGPRCADGYVWWQVNYAGLAAWTAEGNPTYWLTPLNPPALPVRQSAKLAEPPGCLAPPDDYTRVQIGWAQFNARTLAMLDHAQALYRAEGGSLNLRRAIVQGSYNPGKVSASFGTHDAGGAVDLAVRRQDGNRAVLTDQIPLLLRALRVAGFAAWLREPDELYRGSPIHIHAIAVGDRELSEAARGQIDGPFGYLRGYDGLPHADGIARPDRSGERVICQWMADLGFNDLRDRAS
jgi:hypothetical protein